LLLSVVVPCYNEEASVVETHRQLARVLTGLPEMSWEVIYVDDGSVDGTLNHLLDLQASDSRVRVVRLSRNFGHQIAVTAGLEHAAGDAVVIIDADLQDPPEVIVEMLNRWREGYEVVYGRRVRRPGESRFKIVSAKVFYRLLNRLSEIPMPLDVGDFRLIDRKVVQALQQMPEQARFLRGMVTWAGFRQVAVTYDRSPRVAGTTKYPLWRMLAFAADAVSSFSSKPLRLAMWMGFAASGLALFGIGYALIVRLFTPHWVPGWAAIFIAVLFLGGVQLISLGIIGEYVGRVYNEVKRRPLFLVAERHGFPTGNTPKRTPEPEGP
jgi:glycosyltransferase involved in cell wall biosynthesis